MGSPVMKIKRGSEMALFWYCAQSFMGIWQNIIKMLSLNQPSVFFSLARASMPAGRTSTRSCAKCSKSGRTRWARLEITIRSDYHLHAKICRDFGTSRFSWIHFSVQMPNFGSWGSYDLIAWKDPQCWRISYKTFNRIWLTKRIRSQSHYQPPL